MVAKREASPSPNPLQLLRRDADEIALDRVTKNAYDPAINGRREGVPGSMQVTTE